MKALMIESTPRPVTPDVPVKHRNGSSRARRDARDDARRAIAQATGMCRIAGCENVVVPGLKTCAIHRAVARQNRQAYLARTRSSRLRAPATGDGLTHSPEYATVVAHRSAIRKAAVRPRIRTYLNMPFYADWDPSQGGLYINGARWIIETLGRKPSPEYDLHIVDRRLGFVPGNLAWVPRKDHKREELLTKLLIENQRLRARVAELEAVS